MNWQDQKRNDLKVVIEDYCAHYYEFTDKFTNELFDALFGQVIINPDDWLYMPNEEMCRVHKTMRVIMDHVQSNEKPSETEWEETRIFEETMIDFTYRLARNKIINEKMFYLLVDEIKCY